MFWTTKILKLLLELVALTKSILKILRLRKPGIVFLVVTEKDRSMLKFKLVLPAPGASDVVKRVLNVQVGTAEPQAFELDGTALESAELSGSDNEPVVGSLTDTDDAGNVSPASEFSFVLTDTIAPPAPGAVGLVVTSEE